MKMVERNCSVATCGHKVFARFLCRKHWNDDKKARGEVCSVTGCEDAISSKGMCNKHYLRWYTTGTTDLPPMPTMEERFWEKVEKSSGCWAWTGAKDPHGYGVFNKGPRLDRSHRVAYELLVGEIPAGLHLDHLCRNTSCCNPQHLEPVTPRENALRGNSPMVRAYRSNTCQRGHSLNDAYVRPDNGKRQCRACMRMRQERRRNRVA